VLLEPILADLLATGRTRRPPRPWLGMYTADAEGKLVIGGLAKRGPAERAGAREGDQVVAVAGERVAGLADLYRRVWRLGPAGAEVPLTLARKGQPVEVRIVSADRADFLKKPRLH
jgi:S1-C subfamily serine protease